MSGPLAAARRLQALNAAGMRALLDAWTPALAALSPERIGRIADPLDLVEVLHQPAQLARMLVRQPAGVIDALRGAPAEPQDRATAERLLLLDPEEATAYPEVAEWLRTAPEAGRSTGHRGAGRSGGSSATGGSEAVGSEFAATATTGTGAEAAARAVRDAAVLVTLLDAQPVPEPSDRARALRHRDAQRFGEQLHRPPEDIAPLLLLAAGANLAHPLDGRWQQLPARLRRYVEQSPAARWEALAAGWLRRIPFDPILLQGSAATRGQRPWRDAFADAVLGLYPIGAEWVEPLADSLAAQAAVLGLTADGVLSPIGTALLAEADASNPELADADLQQRLAAALPAEVDRLYLQHDLSMIAPGPLRADLDLRLRAFADPEGQGPASRYRIGAASLARALRAGADAAEIAELLTRLGGGALPQPLAYLLAESGDRSAQVLVQRPAEAGLRAGARAELHVDDPQRRAELLVDAALRSLRLRAGDEGSIWSPIGPELVLATLQEARYRVAPGPDAAAPPVMAPATAGPAADTDATDAMQASASPGPEPAVRTALDALLARLTAMPPADGADAERRWLARQLESAIRHRQAVRLRIGLPGGGEAQLELQPAAVAGGRLRGRELDRESERTLPLTSILQLDLLG